jgi:flagellin
MSLVINTNSSASFASMNLGESNRMLQRSLARLSSGSKIVSPADDAGGLAVSMKLEAALRRTDAAGSNVANATSFLQTQDGSLKTAGKVLERIAELKTLSMDATKSAADKANYQTEFVALKSELTNMAGNTFNGVALFGSSNLSVATSEDGTATVTLDGVELLGTPAFPALSENFSNLSNWSTQVIGGLGGSVSNPSNSLVLNSGTGAVVSATTNDSFSGAFEVNLDFTYVGNLTGNPFTVAFGGSELFSWVNTAASHSLRIVYDGAGTATTYLDGSSTPHSINSGVSASSGAIQLSSVGGVGGSVTIRNFNVTSTDSAGGVGGVTGAAALDSLALSDVTAALQSVATFRANNGAQQSRLGYAAEMLGINKANIEAANSRIVDVDVAHESTTLARNSILVQASTAMLAQANSATRSALRLLT